MKSIVVRQTWAAAILIAASCTSCNNGQDSASTAAKFAKPTPEESFQVIVETFRRRVEETPVGFISRDSSGRTTMSGTNEVSSKIIPPANASDPYKAVITVTSQSRYSLNRLKDSSDSAERDKDSKPQGVDPLAETDEYGVEILDPGLMSKPASENGGTRSTTRRTDDFIARRPDHEERQYELVYQNGRWTLITELNSDTERSIQNAFDLALDTQI